MVWAAGAAVPGGSNWVVAGRQGALQRPAVDLTKLNKGRYMEVLHKRKFEFLGNVIVLKYLSIGIGTLTICQNVHGR